MAKTNILGAELREVDVLDNDQNVIGQVLISKKFWDALELYDFKGTLRVVNPNQHELPLGNSETTKGEGNGQNS